MRVIPYEKNPTAENYLHIFKQLYREISKVFNNVEILHNTAFQIPWDSQENMTRYNSHVADMLRQGEYIVGLCAHLSLNYIQFLKKGGIDKKFRYGNLMAQIQNKVIHDMQHYRNIPIAGNH